MNKLAVALALAIAPEAHADINMMEASFKTNFIDLQIEGLNVSRSYDSRSTFSGLFGFGWCSILDTELIRVENSLELRDCGTRKPLTADLKPELENSSYVVKRRDGLFLRFALEDGRLTGLRSPGHTEVQVLWARTSVKRDDGLRRETNLPRGDAAAEGNKRNQIRIDLDPSGRIARVETTFQPDRPTTQADFLYGPEGNLLSVKNAWSNTYRYKYDRLHNLTEISYPDRTEEKLTYDSDYDRVTSFQGRNSNKNKCKETYSHTIALSQKKQLSQISIATLACPSKAPIETRFEFTFKRRQDNRWALAKVSLTRDGNIQNTQYKLGGLQ